MKKTSQVIEASCLGLLSYLQTIEEESNGDLSAFRGEVKKDIAEKETIDWLVPPMLQPRQS